MNQNWGAPMRFFVLTVLVILLSLFLYYIRDLIGPLVVAALIAYLLHPIAAGLDRRTPINYKFSVFLVYIGFLAVLILIPTLVTPIVIDQVASMDIEMQNIINGIDEFISQTTIMGYQVFQGIPGNLEESISETLHPEQVFTSIQVITENVVWVILVMILIYYFMVDWEKIRMWGFDLVPEIYHVDALRLYPRRHHHRIGCCCISYCAFCGIILYGFCYRCSGIFL
jgi:predicted PurR-regulated permease PerM